MPTNDRVTLEDLQTIDPLGVDPPGPREQAAAPYRCSYCPSEFPSCQEAVDHALHHPEVAKNCPVCDFTSPDGIQLLWHVNAEH